ncbi:MAG: MaoC family dehydratase N-terminal domain-containing protein [Actinomycetota bacterium]
MTAPDDSTRDASPVATPGNEDGTTNRVLGRFEMMIERGKIREFARATGATHSAYFNDERPPIPPTFLASAALWQPPDVPRPYQALGMDLRRVLHGEQEYRFYGSMPRAGDRLVVEIRVESVNEKDGRRGGTMRLARIVSDFTDETGRLVAQAWSTTIETGASA